MTDSTDRAGPGVRAPEGVIRLTVRSAGMFGWSTVPTCQVDGVAVPIAFGEQDLTVAAGPVKIEMTARETPAFGHYGHASLVADVAPGQVVPVFYTVPLHLLARGAIGFVPQRRRGWLSFFLLVLSPFLLMGLMMACDAALKR